MMKGPLFVLALLVTRELAFEMAISKQLRWTEVGGGRQISVQEPCRNSPSPQSLSGGKVEACPIFYEIFGTVALGRRTLLDKSLDQVNATEPEKAAFGKIQDCYNEAGLTSKFLDLLLMGSITFSSDCTTYAGEDLKELPRVCVLCGEHVRLQEALGDGEEL
ncbi:hypothetical protein CB1_000753010 [Camelus ferus]|nr:hypothetical protein CB1_000753010 [Camelus ferus]